MPGMADRLEVECVKLKEPRKRALISELREKIKAVEVDFDAKKEKGKDLQ